MDITATKPVTAVEEDAEHKTMGIGVGDVVVYPTVILHLTVGHIECLPIREKTAGPQKMDTKRMEYSVTRCWAVRENAPDRSGKYLLTKIM